MYLCVEVWNSWIYMTSEAGKGRQQETYIVLCVGTMLFCTYLFVASTL